MLNTIIYVCVSTWGRLGFDGIIAKQAKACGGLTSSTLKNVKRINANNSNSYALAA
jgi:hypothetical protein